MTMTKPKLIPVELPWKVEAAISALHLHADETGEFPITVELNAPPPSPNKEPVLPPVPGEPARILPTKPGLVPGCSGARVRLTFTRGIAARLNPGYADGVVVNPDLYDDSLIPFPYHQGQDIDEWRAEYRAAWQRTGLCPDPWIYEVRDSTWSREVLSMEASGLKHYLIEGHDRYVEVLAKGFTWEEIPESSGCWVMKE